MTAFGKIPTDIHQVINQFSTRQFFPQPEKNPNKQTTKTLTFCLFLSYTFQTQ